MKAQREFKDQLNRIVSVSYPPEHIISLVPSQTELLFDLGLDKEVVGITKFCELPVHWQKEKPKIGGTKNFLFDKIEALSPDLVIGNKEENYISGIVQLQERYPVWMSDIVTLNDAYEMIRSISEITDRVNEGIQLLGQIESGVNSIENRSQASVLYLIWCKPWMAVAEDTFIHSVITKAGFKNVLSDRTRYPELKVNQIKNLNPDVVFLPTEPFPFSQKHADELYDILPNARVAFVDGKIFSWYGSHLLKLPEYLNALKV